MEEPDSNILNESKQIAKPNNQNKVLTKHAPLRQQNAAVAAVITSPSFYSPSSPSSQDDESAAAATTVATCNDVARTSRSIKQEELDDDVIVEQQVKQEPDKCPVCLQQFASDNSKAYASKCFHAFCFECILEWSKVKYQCPLCKTDFDRIIYDVVSRLEFKEYALKPRESSPTQDIIPIYPEDEATRTPSQPPRSRASWVVRYEQAPVEFRMLVYQQSWYVSAYQMASYVRMTNIELESNDMPPRSSSAAAATAADAANSDSVTRVDNLECVAYQPVLGYRDTSPHFYVSNPAVLHRLAAFVYRELRALAAIMPPNRKFGRLNHELRDYLTHLIFTLVKGVSIESEQFYEQIAAYIMPLKYARHFQHELNAFARSKHATLDDYDARCVYYKCANSNDIPRKADTVDFMPMRILPIVLTKYKYTTFPELINIYQPPNLTFNIPQFERTIITHQNRHLSAPVIEEVHEEFNTADEGESQQQPSAVEEILSDQSSFCEELTPPPKNPPELIDLISSSGSDTETSSILIGNPNSDDEKRQSQRRQKRRQRQHRRKHSSEVETIQKCNNSPSSQSRSSDSESRRCEHGRSQQTNSPRKSASAKDSSPLLSHQEKSKKRKKKKSKHRTDKKKKKKKRAHEPD